MNFFLSIQKKILLFVLSCPLAITVMAQNATVPAVRTETSSNNQLAILLVIVALVLAFVIWGMGQVLVELGRQALEKNKAAQKALSILILVSCSLFSQVSLAQNTTTVETVKVVPNYGGLSETTFYLFITVIGIEVIAILFLAFSIKRIYVELMPEKEKAVAKRSSIRIWWTKLDNKLFTRAVPVEKEADVMLDHNYDGIRELDNALPPWWKYGFYITIAIAFVYLLNFHVLGLGKNPDEEYAVEMEKAKIQKELYEAQNKDKIDENNVPMEDANGIKIGETLFEANCIACHLKGGGGIVGPNLTDDYWLHKGSLNDIFKTIKMGYPDKGMQSWSSKFNPKEISQLASYIKSLRGSNPPNAKLPQGDMYVDSVAVTPTDTIKAIKKDTLLPVKK